MNTIEQSNITIYIIEDEVLIAEDIAMRLEKLGYDVAGIAHSSEKAIDYLSFHMPDLVLCDIMIKGAKDGIEVAEQFLSKKTPFVFLTSLSDRPTLDRAKKALPYGYILKPFNDRDLLTAVEMALYKHASDLEKLKITKEKIDQIAISPLTAKEYEILLDIAKGYTNKQLMEQHFISNNTVKHHIRNILAKLEAQNRATALHKIIELLTQS